MGIGPLSVAHPSLEGDGVLVRDHDCWNSSAVTYWSDSARAAHSEEVCDAGHVGAPIRNLTADITVNSRISKKPPLTNVYQDGECSRRLNIYSLIYKIAIPSLDHHCCILCVVVSYGTTAFRKVEERTCDISSHGADISS